MDPGPHPGLGEGQGQQSPEVELIARRKSCRAVNHDSGGLGTALGIGIMVFRLVAEVLLARRPGIQRAEGMLNQRKLADACWRPWRLAGPPRRALCYSRVLCFHAPLGDSNTFLDSGKPAKASRGHRPVAERKSLTRSPLLCHGIPNDPRRLAGIATGNRGGGANIES